MKLRIFNFQMPVYWLQDDWSFSFSFFLFFSNKNQTNYSLQQRGKMPQQSRNAWENIYSKGYLESFMFDKYISFHFLLLPTRDLTITEFLGLWGSTGEAIPHHQSDGGVAWWEEVLQEICMRGNQDSSCLKPRRTWGITFCKASHKFAEIT